MVKRQTTSTDRPAMTDAVRRRLEAQIPDPQVNDLQNPVFLYSTIATDLLLAIVGGLIDPVRLAREQLANRGLDENGMWCGFDRAREIHLGGQR